MFNGEDGFRNHSTSLNLLKLFEISNALIGLLSGVNTKIENLNEKYNKHCLQKVQKFCPLIVKIQVVKQPKF